MSARIAKRGVPLEVWMPVPPDNAYEVSNYGGLRRIVERWFDLGGGVQAVARREERVVLPPSRVRVLIGGKMVTRRLDELVLECFRGPRPSDEHELLHRDGDELNNALTNLAWRRRGGT